MIKKGLWGLSAIFYLWVAMAGFGYFGTGSTARNFRSSSLYKALVGAPLAMFLGESSSGAAVSGRIVKVISSGEVKYKPLESFVFYPADLDQVFQGRTVVSTGSGSEIVVSIGDGAYELTLKPSSTVVIDGAPPMGEGGEFVAPLRVEVLSGDISAKSVGDDPNKSQPLLQVIDVEQGTSSEIGIKGALRQKDISPSVLPEAAQTVPFDSQIETDPVEAVSEDRGEDESFSEEDTLPFEESKEGFTMTVEKSMNELFQTELRRVNCGVLLDLRSEVMLTYLENERLRKFLKEWALTIRKHGCK